MTIYVEYWGLIMIKTRTMAINSKIVIMNSRILTRTIYQQQIHFKLLRARKIHYNYMLCLSWVILCQIKSNAWHIIETYLLMAFPRVGMLTDAMFDNALLVWIENRILRNNFLFATTNIMHWILCGKLHSLLQI